MPPDSDDSGTPATSIPSDTATSCTDQPSHVQAPLMLTTVFPTWEDFGVYMDEYQRQTFQVYVYKTSTSVVNRNKTITRQKGKILIPLELKFYAKTLICTYGGKPQYRGKGIRPRQNYRPKECPARMNVLLKRRPGNCDFSKPSGWRIVVTHHRAVHNHPLNAESFLVHPRNRKVENPMVLEAVSALRKAGVKQGVIRNYISEKEPNKKVTQADVNNLLRRIQDNNFIVPLPSPAPQIARFTTEGEDRARNEQSSELVSTTPPIDNVGARDQAPTVNIDELPIIHECSPMESDGRTHNQSSTPALSEGQSGYLPEQLMELEDSLRNEHNFEDSDPGIWEGQVANGSATRPNSRNSLHEISAGSFRLRRGRDGRGPSHHGTVMTFGPNIIERMHGRSEVASGSSRQRVAQDTTCSTQIHSHNDVGSAHNRNPLQTLRDSKEKDSGSFRLRTSRLEAQNLALYAQNAKLIEQNRQYVADLDEAHKRAAKHESMLTSLRTANTSLKKTMIEQSQENARLIAENAKLKMQTRQNSTNVASDGDEK